MTIGALAQALLHARGLADSPGAVAKVTGVPAEDIRNAARLYATGGNGAFYYGLGVTEHSQGSHTTCRRSSSDALDAIDRPGNCAREQTMFAAPSSRDFPGPARHPQQKPIPVRSRALRRIRRHWPNTRITIRDDSHCGRPGNRV
jgi:anaerobic selenocysteine-containing dehydrogenase